MKYWVCKRAAAHAAEALECLGGNGFVEDSGMPLLYRDAPLNSIWEGSGNVAALDVLRAMVKEPEGLPAFMAECELARRRRRPPRRPSASASATEAAAGVRRARSRSSRPGGSSRISPSRSRRRCSCATRRPRVADAFCAARLAGEGGPRLRHAAGRRRRHGDHRARVPGMSARSSTR